MYKKINILLYIFTTLPKAPLVLNVPLVSDEIYHYLLNIFNHYKQFVACQTFISKIKFCIKFFIIFIAF